MHILKVVTLRFNPDREGRHEQEKGVKGITKGNQWTRCLSEFRKTGSKIETRKSRWDNGQ